MSRVKGGVMAAKRRRNILGEVKGYRFSRSTKKRAARDAIYHAQLHAFDHRRNKKGDSRRLWISRINAAIRAHGMSYSAFINMLKGKDIALDRKILATLGKDRPEALARVVAGVK